MTARQLTPSGRIALRFLLPPLLLLAAALVVLAGQLNLPLWLALRAWLLPWGAGTWSALTLVGDALVTPLLTVLSAATLPSALNSLACT